ncbi:hypothetical protein D5S17_30675 [Pseudonocardiaceae bacterium YIM PH 21723]|nr:hypothetical protein D5S17_30675 [Pseudonocardiaceae bacterium YIM PH 21723]
MYAEFWPQVLAFTVLILLAGGYGLLLVLSRPVPDGLVWFAIPTLIAAAAYSTSGLRADQYFDTPHWVQPLIGGHIVLWLLDRRPLWTFALLAIQLLITLGQLRLTGNADWQRSAGMSANAVFSCGVQASMAMAVTLIRQGAGRMERAEAERERVRVARAVADSVHHDRLLRYRALGDRVLPLLSGLAEGRLQPHAPPVRRACTVEVIRMRRLFAEADDSTDQLAHELRACIAAAERNGVLVTLSITGSGDPLPVELRRALLDPVTQLLAMTPGPARVTLVRTEGAVRLGVLTTDQATAAAWPEHPLIRLNTVRHDGSLWLDVWVQSSSSDTSPS